MSSWTDLRRTLARFADHADGLPIWWRDDDAQHPTAALDRLTSLALRLEIPVHLAVVPDGADAALAGYCADHSDQIIPVTHGLRHQNHAPDGHKKAEFGATRDPAELAADLTVGRQLMTAFKSNLAPMFVPPWNRIGETAIGLLPDHGFAILSTYGSRRERHPVPGLTQVNTHIDPIDWHGTRSVLDTDVLLARLVAVLTDRLEGRCDGREPLGLLTHHLVHDAAIWSFTEKLLDYLRDSPAICWRANSEGTSHEPT